MGIRKALEEFAYIITPTEQDLKNIYNSVGYLVPYISLDLLMKDTNFEKYSDSEQMVAGILYGISEAADELALGISLATGRREPLSFYFVSKIGKAVFGKLTKSFFEKMYPD